MINYIRSKKGSINPDQFSNDEQCVWMNDKYLKPSMECDMMLMLGNLYFSFFLINRKIIYLNIY